MTVRAIVAVSHNGIIGACGELPWKLKSDLALFKNLTMGRTVVMGRNTFQSIGKPLSGRTNVVVSETLDKGSIDGVDIVSNTLRLVHKYNDFDIIGGTRLYNEMLECGYVDELIVTHVTCSIASNNLSNLSLFNLSHLDNFKPINMIMNVEANKDNDYSFKTIRYIRK